MSSTATSLSWAQRNALLQLTRSRLIGFMREPEAVFWVFIFPVILAGALGIAFRSQKPQPVPVGFVSGGPSAAALAAALGASSEIATKPFATHDEAALALRTGKIAALVEPAPPDVEAVPAVPFDVRVHHDPMRADGRLARYLVEDAVARAAGRTDPVAVEAKATTERGARYIDFLLPGLLGMNLMGTGFWGVGFPVATARQQKLLKRYIASPMRKGDYLMSFVLARLFWLALEVAILVAFGRLVFGISVTGSWTAYAAVVLVGALAFASMGLLVASRARTIEGVSGLMNAAMVPMWLFSGTFFSSARFPDFLQPAIQALPLTAVNNSLRALTNEAAGWTAVGPSLLLLVAWGLVSFLIAVRIFRWD